MEDYRSEPEEELPPVPLRAHPAAPRVRLVLFVQIGMCLLFSIAGVLLIRVLADLGNWDPSLLSGVLDPDAPPSERWKMRLLLAISHLTTFLFAGWATVRLFYPPARRAVRYLRADRAPQWSSALIGVLLMLFALPLVLFLYQINKALPMPDLFRNMEDQTATALTGLLQMDNGLELSANLFLIALLPALGEELIFRGVLQQQLLRRISDPWIAILLTAAVFSFIHFQFEGFLPRMFLGFILGWLYWQTGNFWVPVMAHFVNNGTQVLGQYLYHQDISSVDLDQDIDVPWMLALGSVFLVVLLMRWLEKLTPAPDTPDVQDGMHKVEQEEH